MKTITIIGGGVAGVSTLGLLVKSLVQQQSNAKIVIIEPNELGLSLPYAVQPAVLLLNTSVESNSIVPDNKAHFLNWIKRNKRRLNHLIPDVDEVHLNSFVPRVVQGMYMNDMAKKYIAYAKSKGIEVVHLRKFVKDIQLTDDGHKIVSADGDQYFTDYVVISTGKKTKEDQFKHLRFSPRYLETPYTDSHEFTKLPSSGKVLIIGSRLSAVDSALLLRLYGHQGNITFASQSGIMPAVKASLPNADKNYFPENMSGNTMEIVNLFEAIFGQRGDQQHSTNFVDDLATAEHGKTQWEKDIIPLCNMLNKSWKNLQPDAQNALLVMLSFYINKYISSIPVENARKIAALLEADALDIQGGLQAVSYDPVRNKYIASYKDNGEMTEIEYDAVINATGWCNHQAKSQGFFSNHSKAIPAMTSKMIEAVRASIQSIPESSRRVFLCGTVTEDSVPIGNAIFVIVQQAKEVVQNLTQTLTMMASEDATYATFMSNRAGS